MWLFALVMLSGCAVQTNQPVSTANVQEDLTTLNNWKISGKIAFITPKERTSAYMNWQNEENFVSFNLNNLLGINLASIEITNQQTILKANNETYIGENASQLIYETTGWRVPIEQLRQWVKGNVGSEEQTNTNFKRSISYYDNGLIKTVKHECDYCDVWDIQYSSYNTVTLNNKIYILPTTINMTNAAYQARIKISISKWSS